MQKTLRQHLEMVYKSRISAGNLCCTVSQERFLARKMRIRTMSIIPCATFQAALYIETHSMMHQSEFDAANVALSDKRKSLINIHKNRYTATLTRSLRVESDNKSCTNFAQNHPKLSIWPCLYHSETVPIIRSFTEYRKMRCARYTDGFVSEVRTVP